MAPQPNDYSVIGTQEKNGRTGQKTVDAGGEPLMAVNIGDNPPVDAFFRITFHMRSSDRNIKPTSEDIAFLSFLRSDSIPCMEMPK